MAGMPTKLMGTKRKVPPVGEDADPGKRVANNGATKHLPDRDGPAKRKHTTPKPATHAPAKGKADIAGMRASLKKMG